MVSRADHDREDAEQETDYDFRGVAESQPKNQDRRDGDLGYGVEAEQDRIDRSLQQARARDCNRHRNADHDAQPEPGDRLEKRDPELLRQQVAVVPERPCDLDWRRYEPHGPVEDHSGEVPERDEHNDGCCWCGPRRQAPARAPPLVRHTR